MSFWDIIKAAVNVIVGVGTGVIVGHYTGEAVNGSKGAYKACATIAAVAIEGLVATKASGYLNDQIDDIRDGVNRLTSKGEKADA